MRSLISHTTIAALAMTAAACGAAYYDDEPMSTEVVVDHQQPQYAEQPPTVVVADPNDPFATPGAEPVYTTPTPTGPRIVSGPQPQPQVVQVSQSLCTNTCRYANDGECDDGRPGAHTSVCAYGTDCGDCGPAPAGGQAQAQPHVRVQAGGGMCTNTCRHANDGECDDGRPGAHTSLCPLGSDCNDCGPAHPQARGRGMCTNTCRHANDGECDDGRPGSHTSLCAFGSDCNDCGPT
ncbi:MAG: hypothetical protein KF901_05360 [Myxococcales bacterium]|nr:hypothetical protein [Myxococcales bacterium]